MNTSDSVIIIEETSVESISDNSKELMAAITKRQRMEQEHEAIRNNGYYSESDDIDNNSDTSEESYSVAGAELVRFLTNGLNKRSSSPNESISSEESYSAKRARWHQEDLERNDCLQTILKMDEKLERLLTHGPDDMPASPDCEYSPASPEYEIPASPTNESIGKTPDSSPKSLAKAWCYACDDDFDFCTCQCPWSPSITYNPCKVCEWEDCKCLKLPIKAKTEINYIVLD